MAGCTCGLPSYVVVYEIDEEDTSAPRRIIIRCRNCGRVRFLLQEKEEDLWYLHDRLPSGREQFFSRRSHSAITFIVCPGRGKIGGI